MLPQWRTRSIFSRVFPAVTRARIARLPLASRLVPRGQDRLDQLFRDRRWVAPLVREGLLLQPDRLPIRLEVVNTRRADGQVLVELSPRIRRQAVAEVVGQELFDQFAAADHTGTLAGSCYRWDAAGTEPVTRHRRFPCAQSVAAGCARGEDRCLR